MFWRYQDEDLAHNADRYSHGGDATALHATIGVAEMRAAAARVSCPACSLPTRFSIAACAAILVCLMPEAQAVTLMQRQFVASWLPHAQVAHDGAVRRNAKKWPRINPEP
jgi:hypothetical protein